YAGDLEAPVRGGAVGHQPDLDGCSRNRHRLVGQRIAGEGAARDFVVVSVSDADEILAVLHGCAAVEGDVQGGGGPRQRIAVSLVEVVGVRVIGFRQCAAPAASPSAAGIATGGRPVA